MLLNSSNSDRLSSTAPKTPYKNAQNFTPDMEAGKDHSTYQYLIFTAIRLPGETEPHSTTCPCSPAL